MFCAFSDYVQVVSVESILNDRFSQCEHACDMVVGAGRRGYKKLHLHPHARPLEIENDDVIMLFFMRTILKHFCSRLRRSDKIPITFV